MTATRDLYSRANSEWPDVVPPMTEWEAVRAAARLWRWGRSEVCPYEIRATSGRRYTYVRNRILWVNPNRPGPDGGGWKAFIHDLSHAVDINRKAHSKHHARLERLMIREVLKRGWLDGRLRTEEKPVAVAADPLRDKRAIVLKRTEASIERWEAKVRRAETALKKLRKREAYYTKAIANSAT